MAIHSITIQNFKGIGPRVKIDLKPVTLLFGPNSAGKSTILHAIHYAHALLETAHADVGRTSLGGDVDLGGFTNVVHDHDLDAPMTLGFEFIPDEAGLREYLARYLHISEEDLPEFEIEAASLELTIKWSSLLNRPIVEKYSVGVNKSPLGEVWCSLDGARVWLTRANIFHPVILGIYSLEGDEWDEDFLDEIMDCLPGRKTALPRWDHDLGLDISDFIDEFEIDMLKDIAAGMVAVGACLRDELEGVRYVGPIRQAPPRNYLPPRQADERRWAIGLGAWDSLARSESLRRDVTSWLVADSCLDTGYRVEWRIYRELDDESYLRLKIAAENAEIDDIFLSMADQLPKRGRLVIVDERKNLELAPCDVGEGIAQVVPIVTAALARTLTKPDGRKAEVGLVVMEQPELHIHPRMQVVLGDLFLSQCSERQFLIETHSEHLMLRLLRRVRETAENELPSDAPQATTDQVAVYYVEQANGSVKLSPVRISDEGEFIDSWPHGFFHERLEELI